LATPEETGMKYTYTRSKIISSEFCSNGCHSGLARILLQEKKDSGQSRMTEIWNCGRDLRVL
jgi:hypothetical protein